MYSNRLHRLPPDQLYMSETLMSPPWSEAIRKKKKQRVSCWLALSVLQIDVVRFSHPFVIDDVLIQLSTKATTVHKRSEEESAGRGEWVETSFRADL